MEKLFKHTINMIVCALISLLTFSADNVNAQLVTNGSFENTTPGQVTGNEIEGWVLLVESNVNPAPAFEIVEDTVQHGSHALKIVINGVGTNSWSIQAVADSIPIKPGVEYRYSIWAKSENPGAQVNFTVGNYNYNEYGVIRPANLTTKWQEFTFEFTISDQQTFARAPIHFSNAANVGNAIYIDNLHIIDVERDLASRNPIVFEAESGVMGSDFAVLKDGEISYIQIQTDGADFTPPIWDYPGYKCRVVKYDVTFPVCETYNLFARIRVGPQKHDDDSFFYANGFGEKDTVNADDWIIANQLHTSGFSDFNDVVHGPGELGEGIWKWINLSQNSYYEQATTFTVEEDNLAIIFQIGGRETGLDIDRFAFGRSDLYFTVGDLGYEEIPDVWEGPPLATRHSKFLGCAYSPTQALNFELYWNQVTPENSSKWGSVERTRDVMNWSGLDAAYNFAKNNGFAFRFHVLIWGNQQPAWIESLQASEQLEEIEEWFAAVANQYPDIDYLEVVNEPLHDPPDSPGNGGGNYIEALGGSNGIYGTGWDWIIKAFELARQYFPDSTKLMINDYNIVRSSSNTAKYLTIINLLQERGLIDGIGFQAHGDQVNSTPVTTLRTNLNSLAATGLFIQVTEMDVDGPTDAIQLAEFQRIFPIFWQHPAVVGITLWGWRPICYNPTGNLINSDGTERPALQWLRTYLASPPPPLPPLPPVPISPDAVGDQPHNPILIWHSSDSATSYHLQVATTSVFTSNIIDTTVADTLLQLNHLDANRRFFWRVSATNEYGTSEYSATACFMTGDYITDVEEHGAIPAAYKLFQNYPNPFNPSTQIKYSIPQNGYISLKVHNLLGEEVATLFEGVRQAGNYVVSFNSVELASGVYLYQLKANNFMEIKKFILIK